jgi:sulfite reductase alpha subunit-like flavoprotein
MVPEAKKRYVQDCVKDEAKRIWSLLEAGAKVFVAGSAEKMPAAVHKAIQEVVREQGLLDEDASARYMTKLETTGRYFVDAW